ncbi:MAG: hypothetical protein R2705_14575 [Ilumatobacteraceae bacterium]
MVSIRRRRLTRIDAIAIQQLRSPITGGPLTRRPRRVATPSTPPSSATRRWERCASILPTERVHGIFVHAAAAVPASFRPRPRWSRFRPLATFASLQPLNG